MLSADSNKLAEEGIRPFLAKPDVFLKVYPETESTNRTAKQAAISGEAGHGSAVLAYRQTAGRGRRGREFYSPYNAGLYLSVILEPEGNIQESLALTAEAAVAVYKAVKELTGKELDIKWVNDLYYCNKKVCGILTEAVTDFESGDIEFAVVGIGLNIYEPEEGYPAELDGIAGALYKSREEAAGINRNQLAVAVINHLLKETQKLCIPREYIDRSMVVGRRIHIMDNSGERIAKALQICRDGRLKVLETDGSESILSYEEVSLKI